MKNLALLLILPLILLSGCTGSKNTIGGAALGGIAGGIAGAQIGSGTGRTAAIIGGTLAGASLGGYIGSYLDRMDRQDRHKLNNALETEPTGTTTSWSNPDTGTDYEVTPTRTYQQARSERYCREYTTEVIIGGKREEAYGTACRRPDGVWEIIE